MLKRYVFPIIVTSAAVIAFTTFLQALGQDSEQAAESVQATDSIELSESNVAGWREHILPTEAELAWEKINWLPNLQKGIEVAASSEKPILLWAMNGHPFGCT